MGGAARRCSVSGAHGPADGAVLAALGAALLAALPLLVPVVPRVPPWPLIALCLALAMLARVHYVMPFLIRATLATQHDELEHRPHTRRAAVRPVAGTCAT